MATDPHIEFVPTPAPLIRAGERLMLEIKQKQGEREAARQELRLWTRIKRALLPQRKETP